MRHTPADERYFLVRTLAADFADGHRIAPHTHEWGQLIYVAAGVVTVRTERGFWVVPPHWAVWAPAGIRHGLRFTGAASLRTLYLRPDVQSPAPRQRMEQLGAAVRVSDGRRHG